MIGNYDVQVWRLVGVSDFRSICGLGGTERPAIRLPWREEAIFCDRREDLETGFAGAAERSADLAMSYPTPVRNRYLKDVQLLARGANLHFDRPAEIRVGHAQSAEGPVVDRSKWPQVRIADAKQATHKETG